MTSRQLIEIIAKQKTQRENTGDFDFIDDRDFQNDFASDDYVKNNIRVRPVSGLSKFDDGQSSMHMDRLTHNESDLEEQKYKRDLQHDIN